MPERLRPTGLSDEGLLEEQIMQDVSILNGDWLPMRGATRLGSQVDHCCRGRAMGTEHVRYQVLLA